MAKIPLSVTRQFLPGAPIARGKVRDTYPLPGEDLFLPVCTDRVSVFDFVLNGEIPQKGEVLNALNVFWHRRFARLAVGQDIVADGKGIDRYLPGAMIGRPDIQKRATVVRRLEMLPVEAIIRGYLTGSGWSAYQKTAPDHQVCGQRLPPGLQDGDRLHAPIFTPTTKAAEGHDEHISATDVRAMHGCGMELAALHLFRMASEYAISRGIVIADTKLEFGTVPGYPEWVILADERFTPDSSRFWLRSDWERSRREGRSPVSYDKQFVRDWAKTQGVDKRDPLNREDVAYVHSLDIPAEVVALTRKLYRYIFFLLTGLKLEAYQRDEMGITVDVPVPPVEVVIGSESDGSQIGPGLDFLRHCGVGHRLHVISCHRNPENLRNYVEKDIPAGAVVIAAAGKAAALPGVLRAWAEHFHKDPPTVIGVALAGGTAAADQAARLSIEELPGRPVVIAPCGEAYFGGDGFLAACQAAVAEEFLILPGKKKEPKFSFVLPS